MNINNYTCRDVLRYTLALFVFSFLIIFVFVEIEQKTDFWVKVFKTLTVSPYLLFIFFSANLIISYDGYDFDEDDLPPICIILVLSIFFLILGLHSIYSKPGTFPYFLKFIPLPGLLFYLHLNMYPSPIKE